MLHATCPCLLTKPVQQYLKQVTGEKSSECFATKITRLQNWSNLAENLASFGLGQGFYLPRDITKNQS